MAKKIWYNVEVECIKESANCTMRKGEKEVIAKVKSKGLAHVTAIGMKSIYKKDLFKIKVI